jgi:alkanesulfonate monooxygenase SsuD/methylene tetrahydromethanopterin reductase-like flavin-dependent oxidoreductase (luciferase family)
MKFYVSTAFRELKEAVEIAKAADDLGYDGVGIPDHVVNGLSDVALRRAARERRMDRRSISTDEALVRVGRVRELRVEKGLAVDGFEVLTPLTDAFLPEHYERAEAGGITGIVTMPWMSYAGPDASLAEKVDGMKRFRKDLALDR